MEAKQVGPTYCGFCGSTELDTDWRCKTNSCPNARKEKPMEQLTTTIERHDGKTTTHTHTITTQDPTLLRLWNQKPKLQRFALVNPLRRTFAAKRKGKIDYICGINAALRVAKSWGFYPVDLEHFKKWPNAVMDRASHETQARQRICGMEK